MGSSRSARGAASSAAFATSSCARGPRSRTCACSSARGRWTRSPRDARGRIERIVRERGLAPFIRSPDIPRCKGRKIWIAGILVTGKEVATKKSEPMIFVSFEDEESIFETVLFPDSFRRHYALLDDGWAFLIFGRIEEDLGALAISVERLETVSRRDLRAAEAPPEKPPVFMWSREHAAAASG